MRIRNPVDQPGSDNTGIRMSVILVLPLFPYTECRLRSLSDSLHGTIAGQPSQFLLGWASRLGSIGGFLGGGSKDGWYECGREKEKEIHVDRRISRFQVCQSRPSGQRARLSRAVSLRQTIIWCCVQYLLRLGMRARGTHLAIWLGTEVLPISCC